MGSRQEQLHYEVSGRLPRRLNNMASRNDREMVGSRAFNVENENKYSDVELRRDLVSYLSEYRLQVQTYDYELLFSYKEGEGYKLRDIDGKEAVIAKAKRAIEERLVRGESIHREEGEFTGIHHLDDILHFAKDGDGLYWISPPGDKKDGYGDYGFFYEGHITQVFDDNGKPAKHLAMIAKRLEKPTIMQCNTALSTLTGRKTEYKSADEFLADPHVDISKAEVDSVLADTFSFTVDKEERAANEKIVAEMEKMINDYIVVVRTGSKEDKIRGLHALENYALELKKRYKTSREVVILGSSATPESDSGQARMTANDDRNREARYLADIMQTHDFKPPTAAGSCGSTSEDKSQSNDIFADNYNNLMKAIFGDSFEKLGLGDEEEKYSFNNPGECAVCKKESMRGPCDICEPCDKNIRAKNKQ